MSSDFIVNPNDNYKRNIYLIKELLREKRELNVICGTKAAPISARVCNTLVNLKYVTYGDIRTETAVVNDKRKTSLIIKLNKSPEFDKMYAENEEKKKRFQETKDKKTEETGNN